MKDQALGNDLRLTIFASFYRVGFDLHDLTQAEKQRMEIIQLYPYLKNGEIWRDIQEELRDIVSNNFIDQFLECTAHRGRRTLDDYFD